MNRNGVNRTDVSVMGFGGEQRRQGRQVKCEKVPGDGGRTENWNGRGGRVGQTNTVSIMERGCAEAE